MYYFPNIYFSFWVGIIVVTGGPKPAGFRAGLNVQNPGLAALGLSGFGLFRASGFFRLFRACCRLEGCRFKALPFATVASIIPQCTNEHFVVVHEN